MHDSDSTGSDDAESPVSIQGLVHTLNDNFGNLPTKKVERKKAKELSTVEVQYLYWMHTFADLSTCYAITRQQAKESSSRPDNSEAYGVPGLRRSAPVAERKRQRESDAAGRENGNKHQSNNSRKADTMVLMP